MSQILISHYPWDEKYIYRSEIQFNFNFWSNKYHHSYVHSGEIASWKTHHNYEYMSSPPEGIAENNYTPTLEDNFQEKLIKGFRLLTSKGSGQSFDKVSIVLNYICSVSRIVENVCFLFLWGKYRSQSIGFYYFQETMDSVALAHSKVLTLLNTIRDYSSLKTIF